MTTSVTSVAPADIAAGFVRARLTSTCLRAYPGDVLPASLDEAYRIQDAALELWPESVRGWKVARIGPGPAWRDRYPQDERLIGPAFASNIHFPMDDETPSCAVFVGGFAAVEAEIVVIVGRNAPRDRMQWTIEESLHYVGQVHLGIEIASSPLASLNDHGAGAVISDFGNNWGIVVGPALPDWRNVSELPVETFIDGQSVGRATVEMQSGPLGGFAFALGKAAQRGRPLRSGDVITTGMITGVHAIRVGQQSRHVFGEVGQVGCRIVAATAYGTSTSAGLAR